MKLSIIVPVYNMAAEGKLEYCIKSLFAQTFRDLEIIAVDDASTDNSLEVLHELAKQNNRLKVIASPVNHHQGGARNLGIRAAQGEFIGMMDSDDWAAPDMFEKLLAKAEETGADVVGCDYNMVYTHTMECGKVFTMNTAEQTGILTEEKKKLLVLKPGSMVVKIYRREIITDNELWFPEDIFYEDNCMSPLWLLHCTHFERVDEPLYYYYQHEASTVHRISLQRSHDRMTAMDLLIEKSKAYGLFETYKKELEFKYAELYLVNTLFGHLAGKGEKKFQLAKELVRGMKKQFPAFMENQYYQEKINPEEQKLIRLLMKSRLGFFAYYYALQYYRGLRKKLKK
ncbi:MAG: glycosyltransferase family 2 protein [Lachnospiraceae bacterium]|nr:glycosyltransferase family 2 protein [Lachnospiraceae bacterium]